MSLAFIFPGQGSQNVGMGEDVYHSFPQAREIFDRASGVLKEDLARLCFSGPAALLKRTDNAQPALLTVSVALHAVLQAETGVKPAALAGHSLGEYTALVVSGALGLETAVRLVRLRGQLMEEACPAGTGGMGAIIGLTRVVVESLCRDSVAPGEILVPANFNSPEQIVISGHKSAVMRALTRASEHGAKRSLLLEVSGPFHSPLMAKVEEELKKELFQVKYQELKIPVVANFHAGFYRRPSEIAGLLARQVANPVQWEDSIHTLKKSGINRTLEIGPGRVLSGLVRRIEREIEVESVENLASLQKFKGSLPS